MQDIIYKSINEVLDSVDSKMQFGITIGNFDGVHLGHKDLIEEIKRDCQKNSVELILITFNPHPHQILFPEKNKYLLNSYDERKEILIEMGVKYIVELSFTRDFSELNPKEFLEKYVFISKRIQKLYVGHDFSFGANKKGDHQFIEKYCKDNNKFVSFQEEFYFNKIPVSSSKIRNNLLSGEIERANELLGRPFYISGVVVKGAQRGRQIGFPTANLFADQERIVPTNGVYITRTMCKNAIYNSITNIGVKPTFEHISKVHIETNIFDFSEDIYGEFIKVYFFNKIRDERKFNSVNDLIDQIKIDVRMANDFFKFHLDI